MPSRDVIFLNELAADVKVMRAVFTAFMFRLEQGRSGLLADIKSGVFAGLEQAGLDHPATQESERTRLLTLERGREFFADVETALGQPQTTHDPSRTN